ncbi:MAG: ARPP-1 family domain-containing protein [Candidatus Hodarchaeales archaeon]|jgi:DNA-binding HxlR family transcriptional regulator
MINIKDLLSAKGTIIVLSYLKSNPGATAPMINNYVTKSSREKLTTATIYRRLKELEELNLIARLPTDSNRLILTRLAEEVLKSNKRWKKVNFQDILQDLGNYYSIGNPVSHEKFTVYPLLKADVLSPVLGLLEAEEKELAWIQETEGSESVEILAAINKSQNPVLIPYLHQVEGGKQDRTIFEPILIPVGQDETNPLKIPAKCIEQSRWRYSSSRGEKTSLKFKSAGTRMASQMANISAKAGDQSTVWETVYAASSALSMSEEEAPTSSYREIQEKSYEKDENLKKLQEILSAAIRLENQVGIICLYGDKLLGLEIYGSPTLWNQFNELVLKGFLTDRAFMQKVKIAEKLPDNLENVLRSEFKDIKVDKEQATGTGDLFRFKNKKWQGISIHYKGSPIHLYATKEQVDILKGRKRSGPVGISQVQVQNIQDPQIQQQINLEQIIPKSDET